MMLESDMALLRDPEFKQFVLEYAKDQEVLRTCRAAWC
jgi:catalase (peroxidase I)